MIWVTFKQNDGRDLTANQNFLYKTRSKTTRIIQAKTSKRISTRTSLDYRGRILINFLLKQKILPQLEQETTSCIKVKKLVNALQYSLIIQNDTLKKTCLYIKSGRLIKIS